MKKLYIGRKCKALWTEWKLGDFVRNFVAVILGIFITFWGTDLIEERAIQRDLKEVISLVRKEVSANREKIKDMAEKMRIEHRWEWKFLSHKNNLDKLPLDSINTYGNYPFYISTLELGSDALEMMKSSGLLKEIKDKELAFKIIEVYSIFADCKSGYDTYINLKAQTLGQLKEIPGYQDAMPRVKDRKEYLELLLANEKGQYVLSQLSSLQDEEEYFNSIRMVDEFLELLDAKYPQK